MPSRYSFELEIKKRSERDFADSITTCQEVKQNKTDHRDTLRTRGDRKM